MATWPRVSRIVAKADAAKDAKALREMRADRQLMDRARAALTAHAEGRPLTTAQRDLIEALGARA